MTIIWQEQSESDVPPPDEWLHPRELARLRSMRFAKRREDWRLGRWTAKCAVAAYLDLPIDPWIFRELEISSTPSGAPEVLRQSRPIDIAISLSHREGMAVCAAAPPWVFLGCDLELVEQRSDGFLTDYFTSAEQTLILETPPACRPHILALLWSAKESLLKALGLGLQVDTRLLSVSLDSVFTLSNGAWQLLCVSMPDARAYRGWWCEKDRFVRTLVTDPAPPKPKTTHVDRDCACVPDR